MILYNIYIVILKSPMAHDNISTMCTNLENGDNFY